jgi:hypothetical protein
MKFVILRRVKIDSGTIDQLQLNGFHASFGQAMDWPEHTFAPQPGEQW